MNFKIKINYQRPFPSGSQSIKAYESDRGRIINSAAIRRLQQKTQVFPLERNSAVRSRLTHSMEVQQVGRFIVQKIFDDLSQSQLEKWGLAKADRHIETLVEMSCLMHDIGNPPFGHFGEAAISEWFAQNIGELIEKSHSSLSEALIRDVSMFEGNAQGIRLVSNILKLNLTYSQAAGILKYTRCGTQPKPDKQAPLYNLQKKVGYYFSEQDYVKDLCDANQMEIGHRHPVAYIMEAADDISYCIADLEDALEKNILDQTQLATQVNNTFNKTIREFEGKHDVDFSQDARLLDIQKELAVLIEKSGKERASFLIQFRVKLVHPLVKHAAGRFIQNIEDIYYGTLSTALLEDYSASHALTEALKKVAQKFVFCHQEVEARELQGYRIISGLLECYKPLLMLSSEEFKATCEQAKGTNLLCRRLAKKLPDKHFKAYERAVTNDHHLEFYYRCRLIQDYISGMTDQYAYDEYRLLHISD